MPDHIINILHAINVILESIIKALFNNKLLYLGATFCVFYVNNTYGGAVKHYPFLGTDNYIKKTIMVVEDIYNLSK